MVKRNIKNKLATGVLAAGMATASILNTGCENADNKTKDPEAIKKEIQAKKDSIEKAKQREKDIYFQHAIDSIKEKNGYADYNKELNSLPSIYRDKDDIRNIYDTKTLQGTIDREFYKATEKTVKDLHKQACDLLKKYDILNPDDMDKFDITEQAYMLNYLDPKDIKSGFYSGEYPVLAIYYEPIYESEYGDARKDEIENKMDALVLKAAEKVKAANKEIDARYADYHLEDGSGLFDTDNSNNFMIVKKTVSVYDQNLNMDFFGEKGAKYELVSLKGGKWQVVKTRKNGTVEKTHVFQDAKDFEESKSFVKENTSKVGDTDLKFSAGKNKGVRVEFSKITKIKKRKVWKPVEFTQEEQHKIDSLADQIKYKARLDSLCQEAEKKAEVQARELTKRRFNSKKTR